MKFDYQVLDQSERILFGLRSLYREYGYQRYKMSKFEEYDLYARNKNYLVSDGLITFTDTTGKLMALKPDVTLSIIKNIPDQPQEMTKLCYNESVYRVSKGTGTFKEIMQTGVECLGNVNNECISEVLLLATQSLEMLSDEYSLTVCDLDILSSFIETLSDDSNVQQFALKCVSEKNIHELDVLCTNNGIPLWKAESLKKLIGLYGSPDEVLTELEQLAGAEATLNLKNQLKNVMNTKYRHSIQIDFSAVGNMKYYNGVVFKGYIAGIPQSVLSGGRYDRLMKRMQRKSGAIGFAVYLDALDRLKE